MKKKTTKLKAFTICLLSISLAACQNSEKSRNNTRVEVQKFTNEVNDAIYAKDVNFILNNWNPETVKPQPPLLEHSFRQLDPELSSAKSKLKQGFSKETGKVVKATKVYETLSSVGKVNAVLLKT